MRLFLLPLLAALVALPAAAQQQISPMTGTTATPAIPGAATAAPPDGARTNRARRPRMTARERFEAANTTHDGKLTLDQAQAGHMIRVARNFDAIDSAHHGYVTEDDIRAYNRSQRAARKAARAAKAQ